MVGRQTAPEPLLRTRWSLVLLLQTLIVNAQFRVPLYITTADVLIGSPGQKIRLTVSLLSQHLRVVDEGCGNWDLVDCPSYCVESERGRQFFCTACQNCTEGFCDAFCSSLCCPLDDQDRCHQRMGRPLYNHSSSSGFNSAFATWRGPARLDDQEAGFLARDQVSLCLNRLCTGSVSLGELELVALTQPRTTPPSGLLSSGTLGLAPRSDWLSLAEVLHRRAAIPFPLLTLVQSYNSPEILFGTTFSSRCLDFDFEPSASPNVWLLQGQWFRFLSYEHKRPFKVVFEIGVAFYAPPAMLSHLRTTGEVVAQQGSQYKFTDCRRKQMRTVFELKLGRTRPYGWTGANLFIEGMPDRDSCYTYMEPMPPNPDGLDMILNTVFFNDYCLVLDYGNKRLGLAPLIPLR